MPEPITPGAVAYDAYWRVLAAAVPGSIEARWDLANSLHRAAWEAAAQAVRTQLRMEIVEAMRPIRPVGAEEEHPHA